MAQVFAGPKPVFQQARAAHRRSSWLELHGYHLTEDAGDGTTVEREVFSGQKNTHHLAGGYWKSTIARKQADPQGQTATPDAAIDISRRRTITIGRRATSVACDRVESRSPGLPDIGGKIAGVDGLGNLSADDSLQTGSRLAKLQTTGSVGSTITTSAISPSASTHERLSSSTCPLPQLSRSHQPSTLSSKGDILWPRRRPRRGKTFENIEKHNYNLSGLSRDSIASRSTITNPVHASIRSTTSESKALSLGLSMKFLSKSTPSIGDLIVSSSGTYTQNRSSSHPETSGLPTPGKMHNKAAIENSWSDTMARVEELEALMDGFSTVLSGKNDSAERDESYADAGRNGTASRGFKHGQSIPAKELGNCDDDRLHAESDGSGTIQADEDEPPLTRQILKAKAMMISKMNTAVSTINDQASKVKLRRLVEAVFMSYSVYGGWKPRAVVTPRHFQKNVHMALNTFEELCKVSKLTDLKTLPPARVWKIFMTVSGGASQISFDGFVSALESIAEIKKVDTGMVYQAIASLNPEQMMWIHVHE